MDSEAYREMAETEGVHWWYTARRRILSEAIARLSLPKNATILEAGAGTGGNLAMLAQFGTISAMEMDPFAVAYASEHAGIPVESGKLPDDIPFADAAFDMICLFDVLEHVEHPVAALQGLAAKLRPGGYVLIAVPAYMWLWSRHDEVMHHFRRYTANRLGSEISAAGLKLERISYFNSVMFPAAVLSRFMAKATGRQAGARRVPARPVNGLLYRIFDAERHLLGRWNLPFGLSIMAVARAG